VASVTPNFDGWRLSRPNGEGTNTTLGRFFGNELSNGHAVEGYASGESFDFVVVGWSGNIAKTWAEAQAWWNNGNERAIPFTGWFGWSSIARNLRAGGEFRPTATLFGPGTDQVQGFQLNRYDPYSAGSPTISFTQENGQLVLSWPASAEDFILQGSPNLTLPNNGFAPVFQTPVTNGGTVSVSVPTSESRQFFRLMR
jgi:hypothetical protein